MHLGMEIAHLELVPTARPKLVMVNCWTSNGVNVADVLNHSLVRSQIEALEDPARDFELAPNALPAVPKWGRACNWTPRDDAMLLLGVYRYGIDHWDK